MTSEPWIVAGDFNAILSMRERLDFYHMLTERSSQEFKACVEATVLTDIKADGLFYTWSNNRSMGYTTEKLDRILINDQWMQ